MSEHLEQSTAQEPGRNNPADAGADRGSPVQTSAGRREATSTGQNDAPDHDQRDAPGHGSPTPSLLDRLKRTDRVQLGIVFVIGLALVMFVRGVSLGTTGEDRYKLGTHIESVDPIPDATQVPPESAITIDLETGFIGTISIDGVEIETVNIEDFTTTPGQQVDLPPVTVYAPGNATLTFQPQPGSAIERYEPGLHDVTVRYWKSIEGEAGARTYSWKFWVL